MKNCESGLIYLLTNEINGKQYVGQTKNIDQRMRCHRDQDSQVVDKAISKYGWKNFNLTILERNIPQSKLDDKEKKYIKKYNIYEGEGYNMTTGGRVTEFSPEVCEKLSKALKGREITWQEKLRKAQLGKTHSEEAREKMSKAHSGREITWGDKIGKAHLGQKHTEEAREKMRGPRPSVQGGNHPRVKLTEEQGKQIKREHEKFKDATIKSLAKKYNVSKSTIGNITRGAHWTVR